MADIFISYSSAERQVTEALARDLEAAGYSVWWDTSLVPGDVFKDVIEEKIAASKAAVVIWTKASIKSKWVYSEATRADAQGKLVPLRTAEVTPADIPLPFGATHTDVVDNRKGIVAALERLGVKPTPKPAPLPTQSTQALPTDADEQRRARMARMKAEEEHWDLIKRSRDAAALQSFLSHYPDGTFAATARARLAQVESEGGNRTPLFGAMAAVVLAVVGAGAWWAGQPSRTPPELVKPTEEARRQADAIARADDELLKRQRADAEAKARADAETMRIARADADADRQRTLAAAQKAPSDNAQRSARERSEADSRERFERAAAAGDARGMAGLAGLYYYGRGVSRDYAKAREWYEKAAAAGDAVGMAGLGGLFYYGHGVSRDYVKAREWFEKSAAAGDFSGMVGVAGLFYHGHGVSQDHAKARDWYEKAAAAGDGRGMAGLAGAYYNGHGVGRDSAKAREWYEKAAEAGDSLSMLALSVMMDGAIGGSADFQRAAQMLVQSALLQHPPALEVIRSDMSGWKPQTRIELKRELARLGHYKGLVDAIWNDDARAAFERYLKAQ